MTVTATNTYSELVGNGSATAFPFTFAAASAAEVDVYLNGALQGGGYTVTLNSSGTGGTVTFDTAPANGVAVLIASDPAFTQDSTFENNAAFRPDVFNRIHDRLSVYSLWLRDRVRLLFPSGPLLPAARAGKYLAFDAGGDPVFTNGTGSDSTLRTDIAASIGSALVGFLQSGTGAVARTLQAKARERVSVFDFGAVGDGTTDDTAAFLAALAALPSGGTLHLGSGNSFKLSQSLILKKPIRIVGGTQEENKLLFSNAGTYQNVGDGTKAAVIIVHTETAIVGNLGDARRTRMDGLTIEAQASAPASLRGLVICAPSYFSEVRVKGFTSTGFAVMAGDTSPIDGNANGTSFSHCASFQNGSHGFYFLGNDANACLVSRSYAAECGGWGFYDDSLLGNTYIQCEADNNVTGGYYCNAAKPSASAYLSCYSETAPHFSVGPLCQLWGAQGLYKPARSSGGVNFRGLPGGTAYVSQPVRVATTDDIAEALGGAAAPGPAVQLSENGIEWRVRSGENLLRWSGDYDANYVTLAYNGAFCMRLPKAAVAANIRAGFPYFENGITIGAAGATGMDSGTAAPTTGTYAAGFIRWNSAPAAAGKIGWVCVTGGTPGTWKAFGAIDA